MDDKFLEVLAEAPDSQLATSMTKKVRELIGKSDEEKLKGLKEIIGDCINYGLASTFVMKILQTEHKLLTGDFLHGKIYVTEIKPQ